MKNAKTQQKGYLTPKEVATRLGVSAQTIRNKIRSGHIPAILLPGIARTMIPVDAFERYEASAVPARDVVRELPDL